MSLYFLAASLPLLQFGDKPFLSEEAFLQACDANMAPPETSLLRDLLETDGAGGGHPFLTEWKDRETEIRNAVVKLRAHARRAAAEPFLRSQHGARVYIQKAVTEAFQLSNPLERERALDQLRWTILDELAGLNPFGLEAVMAYGRKLRLAWRWASFDREAGEKGLDRAAAAAAGSTAECNGLSVNSQKAAWS